MAKPYLLAIDQGTTGTTVLVLDVRNAQSPAVIGRTTIEFPQYYPEPGLVEHRLDEIWHSVGQAVQGACSMAESNDGKFSAKYIEAIGITNQRETLCTFMRGTGEPIFPAIVWQDKRSQAICQRLKSHEPFLRERTGLVFDPYFSGTKIAWLLEQRPEIASGVKSGKVLFGTIDTYLLYKLTGGAGFATEPSNASRTQLFDIRAGRFDRELSSLLGLSNLDCLPEVKDSAGSFGKTSGLGFLPDGIPITGILGDQQAALAGQTCFRVGEAKCTYGTGAFMLLNTGKTCELSRSGLLTTVAWRLNSELTYAFEGSSFIAGASIQFLRDQFKFLTSAYESEFISKGHRGAPEVYFVPALSGLGAPYWNADARGAFFGLTRGTSREQMVKAALEGIAFSVDDLYQAMLKDFPAERRVLRVDGGAAANDFLMQFQANISQAEVDRPKIIETTAFGAALFAGLGVGMYRDLSDLAHMRASDHIFTPDQKAEAMALRGEQVKGWQRAIRAVQVFSGA